MGFDTPAGTRGARQPRGGLMLRWVNKTAASRFRRTGKTMGINGLILTTIGARSGAERTNPVGWWPGPDGSWLIVAAANGAARNPAWYHNIAAHPDKVQIQVDGRRIGVTAEQLHGTERAQAWRPAHDRSRQSAFALEKVVSWQAQSRSSIQPTRPR
jgi:deazaflavin-dependent oxidoreductase (nitroreductase family)